MNDVSHPPSFEMKGNDFPALPGALDTKMRKSGAESSAGKTETGSSNASTG